MKVNFLNKYLKIIKFCKKKIKYKKNLDNLNKNKKHYKSNINIPSGNQWLIKDKKRLQK